MEKKSKFKIFLNQLLIASVLFGTLVGAGFASGKETWYYFASFGTFGYFSILLAGVIFFLCALLFLNFGKKMGINSVQHMNKIMFGKFAIIGEMVMVLSNIILLASMFAGANSLFQIIVTSTSFRLASVITAIIALVIVWFGFGGITKANVIIVPLILSVLIVCLFAGSTHITSYDAVSNFSIINIVESVVFAILFIASNMFFAGFIFARLGKDFSKSEIIGGSFFGALFLTASLALMSVVLFLNPEYCSSDMPLVAISNSLGQGFSIFTLIVVWVGLITTAIALLYTISNWLKNYFGSVVLASITTSAVAMLLSGFGFSNFIAYVYPIFGIIGIVYIVVVARVSMKKENEVTIKTDLEKPIKVQTKIKTVKAKQKK